MYISGYMLCVPERIQSKPVLIPPYPKNTSVEYGQTASFQCHVKSVVQPHIQVTRRHSLFLMYSCSRSVGVCYAVVLEADQSLPKAIQLLSQAVQNLSVFVLFNDALNTFYLWLYGVRYMVKNYSDGERGNILPPHGLLFPISSKGSFICIIPQTG